MDKVYNFYNIEASFRNFLSAGNRIIKPVSIKNYMSDLRHFLGWLVLKLKSNGVELSEVTSENLFQHLKTAEIAQYKAYLERNNIPLKTINRRLSTLRKFGSFCISQRWIDQNPAKHIKNLKPAVDPDLSDLSNDLYIEDFEKILAESNSDRQESKKIIETVREFLSL